MIVLNGEPSELHPGETVADVLVRLGLTVEARGIAVAVDSQVVARSEWASYALPDGARIEVLTAMQGG